MSDKVTVIREDAVPAEIIKKVEAVLKEHEARLVARNGRIEFEYGDAVYWIKDDTGDIANDLPRIWSDQRLVTQDY